jgi:enhancing lycopene biosynthesis protein 2
MKKTLKFAVVLSGCGVYDGAEIHEATLCLYAISRNGYSYQCFAPDIPQHHVINHLTGEVMEEQRNVLVESARIARGNIKPLHEFDPSHYDALLFPGGFGAAKNLSDWAFKGSNARINPETERSIKAMAAARKPIGAMCISPVLIAKVLGDVEITVGDDKATVQGLLKTGASHVNSGHGEVVTDHRNLIVTTPCYMLNATIAQVGLGAENLVKAIAGLTGRGA